MKARRIGDVFQGRELALMRYAEKLTLTPARMEEADIAPLRAAGLDDGEILEANQIVCYFNYVNRSINGLGVSTEAISSATTLATNKDDRRRRTI